MSVLVERAFIIGAGLIGGSLAKALRERGLVSFVSAYGRNQQALQEGVRLGVIDAVCTDLIAGIAAADLIVLSVPTLTVEQYLPLIAKHRKATSVVTDVASVKGEIADKIIEHLGAVPPWFVLGHPIAGSERSGITASNSRLYENHKVIITPCDNTDKSALVLITQLWQCVGAEVVEMSITEHDQVLAATSHLPHVLAFSLVDTLRKMDERVDIFRFAAGGFRDFSRIASSHPAMWHDIVLANKTALLSVMNEFQSNLTQLQQAIEADDSVVIMALFERAKTARDEFVELNPVAKFSSDSDN